MPSCLLPTHSQCTYTRNRQCFYKLLLTSTVFKGPFLLDSGSTPTTLIVWCQYSQRLSTCDVLTVGNELNFKLYIHWSGKYHVWTKHTCYISWKTTTIFNLLHQNFQCLLVKILSRDGWSRVRGNVCEQLFSFFTRGTQ